MSFENPFESKEFIVVTRERVLETLKTDGKIDSALELLGKWIDENNERIRVIEDQKEQFHAQLAFDIERFKVYIEAGFLEEAREEIAGGGVEDGLLASPCSDEELEQLHALLEEIDHKSEDGGAKVVHM